MKSIVFSHKGKREVNQDFVLVQNINPETYLHLIADGMGGYEHGEIAAKLVAAPVAFAYRPIFLVAPEPSAAITPP